MKKTIFIICMALVAALTACGNKDMKDGAWTNASSLCRVNSGNIFGNASVIENENGLIIVTAAHCIDKNESTVKVIFSDQNMYESQDIKFYDEYDLAFIYVNPDRKMRKIKAVALLENVSDAGIVEGSFLYIPNINMDLQTELTYAQVIDPWIYSEDFGFNMIYMTADVSPGMSGSGVYNENEELVGILVGGADLEAVAVPIAIVVSLVNES